MKFTGRVEHVIDKSGTKKDGTPFMSAQYVITETEGIYPQSGLFETFGDRAGTAKVGDIVEVEFNLKCDEYQGKFYGKNSAWRIEVKIAAEPLKSVSMAQDPLAQPDPVAGNTGQEQSDDLPF